MIMSDKRLKVCLRGAAVFLAVSIVFCIAVICGVNIQKSNMEKQRLDTETKLAEMQMPTFAPQSTEEVKSDGDGATGESNAVKTAADALGIDDVIQWAMPTEIQNRKSILTMPWRHKSILNKWVMKSV